MKLPVQRTLYGIGASAHDVRVDLRGLHVAVADEFLHGADVVAALERVGRAR